MGVMFYFYHENQAVIKLTRRFVNYSAVTQSLPVDQLNKLWHCGQGGSVKWKGGQWRGKEVSEAERRSVKRKEDSQDRLCLSSPPSSLAWLYPPGLAGRASAPRLGCPQSACTSTLWFSATEWIIFFTKILYSNLLDIGENTVHCSVKNAEETVKNRPKLDTVNRFYKFQQMCEPPFSQE